MALREESTFKTRLRAKLEKALNTLPTETNNPLHELIRRFGRNGNADIAHYIEKDLLAPLANKKLKA